MRALRQPSLPWVGSPSGILLWSDGSLPKGTSWRAMDRVMLGSTGCRPRHFASMCAKASSFSKTSAACPSAVFYVHPWEIDPNQPRQHRAPLLSRSRHYLNLERTEARLRRLLRDFTWTRMDRLFLTDGSGPFPVIPSWTDRKSASQ